MKIEKKYSKLATQYTYEKMIAAGVELDKTMLESYKSVLGVIAAKKNYDEGQPLDPEDAERIKSNINALMNDAIRKHAASLDFVKEETSPHRYVFGAYSYLTALTMDALNCPELPKDMGKELMVPATRRLIETKPPRKSAEEYFNQQRRKDFLDISEGIIKLITDVYDKPKDHKATAELFGQYRALSERQKNHTGIWRFFHREENENRNNLLKAMEDALRTRLPGGIVDPTKEPTDVYYDSLYFDYSGRVSELSDLVEIEPDAAFGYDEIKLAEQRKAFRNQKGQEEPVREEEKKDLGQEAPVQDEDQKDLLGRLTEDLSEASTERTSKIDPAEIDARAKTF